MNERPVDRLRVFSDLDFSALAAPLPRRPVVWRLRTSMPGWMATLTITLAIVAGSTAVFGILRSVGILITGTTPAAATWVASWTVSCVAIVVGAVLLFRWWHRRFGRPLTPLTDELRPFADANGLDTSSVSRVEATLPAPSGCEGKVQRLTRVLQPAEGSPWPPFLIGRRVFHDPVPPDFRPTERRQYPGLVDDGLFLAVPMPRRLPHIALLRDFELSSSPLELRTAYSMGLEFDEVFTLLCPPGYERDALYLFTPDVMAAMIDDAGGAQWGAEVLDDQLFFRFPPSSLPGAVLEEDLRRAFRLVERTSVQLEEQARRYSDARVGERSLDLIDDAGRRVGRRRIAPALLIALVALPFMVIAPFVLIVGEGLLS
ncbi:hypothetical protein H4J02_09905 [Protaetiibacter sp. SSC-01]|uniref:hypothetical protein n=1 Tax=Protaetiibacter sp. SSC-01 TaxID=2759943 RepID=UPI001656E185|nr:hypothetical protein [Protaetiibacter sp. SSC-01]QNO36794.1 hypothetical protein H4J02_09905 [Protaetiibacter sp. SSC-01]